ncbi:M20 family metallopeptidase [Paenibacillus sp. JNUCC31]|uniref:M20 family metallopeptidase n=1 Tax=Paenibacillus sp. JNUCC-31 TaxID=2777983 RepID=UPI00177BE353|nr:M20 family metallopeptidase [Paenibacillus sp. JNUCC-31]QOS78196.1 M20 family metallopeptidase [Paenibacillus sp. JNUCC-31]
MSTNFWDNKEADMLDLIEKIVNIDSGTFYKAGVEQVGDVLASAYQALGFQVTVDQQSERGDHLVIVHPEEQHPDILIIGHMDTVFPVGTAQSRPFSQDESFAYGPGIYDMKASLVMTLFAIKSLIERGDESFKRVKIILNSDEEHGSIYSRELIEREAASVKYALIVEPSDMTGRLITGRRGGGKFELHVTGKAAHSGEEPEKGRSAIGELAHKIIQLHALTDPGAGVHVNVGVISGGTTPNTIAAHAKASIDVRMETLEQAMELERKIRDICGAATTEGTTLVLKGSITRPPMIKTVKSEHLLKIVQEEALQLGESLTDMKIGSGSDGNLTSAVGVATIDALGPRGGNAHTAEEFLDIESLVPRTRLLANLIKRLSRE